jgi:hypothetical protein
MSLGCFGWITVNPYPSSDPPHTTIHPPCRQKQGGKETYTEFYKERARACQHPCVFRKAFQARRELDRQYHAVVTVWGYVSAAETQAALFTTFGSNCEACCGGLHGKSPSSLRLELYWGRVGIHVLWQVVQTICSLRGSLPDVDGKPWPWILNDVVFDKQLQTFNLS